MIYLSPVPGCPRSVAGNGFIKRQKLEQHLSTDSCHGDIVKCIEDIPMKTIFTADIYEKYPPKFEGLVIKTGKIRAPRRRNSSPNNGPSTSSGILSSTTNQQRRKSNE
jgi:hypothetical protein